MQITAKLVTVALCATFLAGSIQWFRFEGEAEAQGPVAPANVEAAKLEPGRTYLVRVVTPMLLPRGMELDPTGSTKQGFYHEGIREDERGTHCGGDITQLLDDTARISYRCERCGKKWR